jgi:hypothetical protein
MTTIMVMIDEELPEISSNHNDVVRIWANDSTWYPLVDEEQDNSSPEVLKGKDLVEVPLSGSQSCVI